jgi:uncharacterized membrane protein YkvA (DUF1232 family)
VEKDMPIIQGIIDEAWLTWKLLMDPRVPMWTKAVVLLPLIYVLSPIDIIPDVFLGLGQLDDIGIVLAGMRFFQSLVPENIVAEHRIVHTDDMNTVQGKSAPRKRKNEEVR